MSDLEDLEKSVLDAVAAAGDEVALEEVRVAALGKKGSVSERMKTLGAMSPEERQVMGPVLNGLKTRLADAIAARKDALHAAAIVARLEAERVDITLPPAPEAQGAIHPISQVIEEVVQIFADLGFNVEDGPDIESDFHNFTALNIPPEHPARQMHDTFYLPSTAEGEAQVLRTHTSPVQIRTMLDQEPPHRIVAVGRVYRSDSDQTHTPMFHQLEALAIDRDIHMGHLKWTIEEFVRAFFEVDEVEIRFRPSHFPFTEPSAEVDVRCDRSGGEVRIGQGDDWLEILGSGMVHPNVLRNCKLDPEEWQGFAFGLGIDRIAMLKYGMPDLRDFFHADLRWLRHYGFGALDMPSLATGLSR